MKVYIATAFERKADHNRVRDQLVQAGHALTYDWTVHEDGATPERDHLDAMADIQGVLDADVLVVLLPGGFGTHIEFGAALASGLPVLVVGHPMRRNVFYQHPAVLIIESEAAIPESLDRLCESNLAEVRHAERRRLSISEMVREAHSNSFDHGFWDAQKEDSRTYDEDPNTLDPMKVIETIPEKLCLIHSEVSEALEDYRDGRLEPAQLDSGKPIGFPSELADIVIRVGDLAGAMGIDLTHEIDKKMRYNRSRPYKHGKAC